MSEHHAGVRWTRTSPDFTYDTYNRSHEMVFKDGAVKIAASSAPAFKGEGHLVDPEETLIAALSSCHMLTFLAICARKRLTVESYEDDAIGYLETGENKRFWIARVTLRPAVRFAPDTKMDDALLTHLHEDAHRGCFIANSVKTDVRVEPRH
jgi:organic hydroperoxide reductase OsmC/OhrA